MPSIVRCPPASMLWLLWPLKTSLSPTSNLSLKRSCHGFPWGWVCLENIFSAFALQSEGLIQILLVMVYVRSNSFTPVRLCWCSICRRQDQLCRFYTSRGQVSLRKKGNHLVWSLIRKDALHLCSVLIHNSTKPNISDLNTCYFSFICQKWDAKEAILNVLNWYVNNSIVSQKYSREQEISHLLWCHSV